MLENNAVWREELFRKWKADHQAAIYGAARSLFDELDVNEDAFFQESPTTPAN